MSHNDNYIKIMEKMGDIQSSQGRIEEKTKNLESIVKGIQEEDKRQNDLLAEHIAGVQTNRERLDNEVQARKDLLVQHEEASQKRFEELDERLKIVEFLPNLMTNIWKATKWIAAFLAAVTVIAKFLGYF